MLDSACQCSGCVFGGLEPYSDLLVRTGHINYYGLAGSRSNNSSIPVFPGTRNFGVGVVSDLDRYRAHARAPGRIQDYQNAIPWAVKRICPSVLCRYGYHSFSHIIITH
jgi:hypothetical protein